MKPCEARNGSNKKVFISCFRVLMPRPPSRPVLSAAASSPLLNRSQGRWLAVGLHQPDSPSLRGYMIGLCPSTACPKMVRTLKHVISIFFDRRGIFIPAPQSRPCFVKPILIGGNIQADHESECRNVCGRIKNMLDDETLSGQWRRGFEDTEVPEVVLEPRAQGLASPPRISLARKAKEGINGV